MYNDYHFQVPCIVLHLYRPKFLYINNSSWQIPLQNIMNIQVTLVIIKLFTKMYLTIIDTYKGSHISTILMTWSVFAIVRFETLLGLSI